MTATSALQIGKIAVAKAKINTVHHDATTISADPRSRRHKTIPADQLALDGDVERVCAHSFIVANLDITTPDKARAVEWWYRHRTDIEDRIRDAKQGAALRHLPSGRRTRPRHGNGYGRAPSHGSAAN